MKYKIIDNFLDINECNALINDAYKFSNNNHTEVLNKRLLLPSTSTKFISLLKKSKVWNDLHTKLNSKDFLKFTTQNLEIKNINLSITNFFFNNNPSWFLKKYKDLNNKPLSNISNKSLLFYVIYKFLRNIIRYIKYKFTFRNYVELLYDYSKSPNGYYREIHRDSDSRTIVFLLYLNNLSINGTGGDLGIYKFKDSEMIPSQPKKEDCLLIENIKPKPGRLVLFLNSHDSLHSVNEMKNHDGYRHFLYGSFTLLGKKNPLLKKSIGSLKTDFNIFD